MRDRVQIIRRFLGKRNVSVRAAATGLAMLLLFLLAAMPAWAQTQKFEIDCLPPWEANDRFLKPTRIKHPGLSLNGFDCGDNCNAGYGLKQALEKVYGSNPNAAVQDVFGKMAKLASEPLKSGEINDNSAILQSRGFVALSSYVIEKNDYDPTLLTPALPAAKLAINNFQTALIQDSMWKMNKDITDDGVKWTESVTNVARAIDFYLALENAYKHFDYKKYIDINSVNIPPSEVDLLSKITKNKIMREYTDLIEDLEDTSKYPTFFGNNIIRYHFEAGNASLKMQVAIGYAVLTLQDSELITSTTRTGRNKFIRRSFDAAGGIAANDGDRYWHYYWAYQSAQGKSFWAEGPYYFHITLSDIIPFWHAVRINNLLSNTSLHSHRFKDPFRQTWFLNPLHWLADISTPDGKTPPLDDGNKSTMYNAGLLHWKKEYGDDVIGRKFEQIAGVIKNAKRSSLQKKLYPVAIAIPRHSIRSSSLPDGIQGNQYKDRMNGIDGRQEVVLRRTINGKQHYILLNGESDYAIERGEGHEQGDQMQLLYYVDDVSYLADSGYDKPRAPGFDVEFKWQFPFVDFDWNAWLYSTWNTYSDHNVMTMKPDKNGWYDNNRGIRAPSLSINKRLVNSFHQNVDEIFYETHGNIDLISASVDLRAARTSSQDSATKTFANYYRNVLFVQNFPNPYLIDINAITGYKHNTQNWNKMHYHINANNIYMLKRNYLHQGKMVSTIAFHWSKVYKSENNIHPPNNIGLKPVFVIQPFTVERSLYFSQKDDKIRESYIDANRGIGIDIKKLTLHGNIQNNGNSKQDFTTVSFIRLLPNRQGIKYAKEHLSLPKINNGNRNDRDWQYYTWEPDSNKVDVVVSRKAKYYVNPVSSSGFNRNPLHFPVPEADSFYVELPSNANYGFARIIKKKNTNIWNIDSSFQLNLKRSIPQITFSGPLCLKEGSFGDYIASVSGGKPPYSYHWSFYRICSDISGGSGAIDGASDSAPLGPSCSTWNSIGRTQNIQYGGYNGEDFKIKLTLTDSSSPARSVTSNELRVQVLSSTEGSCLNDADQQHKLELPTEQRLVSNANLLEADESIPETYALHPNFPNPFNPSTEILFDLPETTMVSLVVYDVLGREVARLVDGELPAGWRRIRFDAESLSSGIYLYRMQAGDFKDTGRMLLLK